MPLSSCRDRKIVAAKWAISGSSGAALRIWRARLSSVVRERTIDLGHEVLAHGAVEEVDRPSFGVRRGDGLEQRTDAHPVGGVVLGG